MATWDGARRPNGRQVGEQEVVLSGVLSEFREALEAEIRAIRSGHGGNSIALRQGRRVLHGAGLHHYEFQVDFPQRLPSDAPANLVVEGRPPVKVTVGQAKGLSLTLVSPEDLGRALPHASLQTDASFLLEKLIERIEGTAAMPNPVGDRLIGQAPVQPGRWDGRLEGEYGLLPEQEAALRQALGGDVFIWGPPGTGKTQTIGAIVAELVNSDRSVLLVSHTNSAVDGGLSTHALRPLQAQLPPAAESRWTALSLSTREAMCWSTFARHRSSRA